MESPIVCKRPLVFTTASNDLTRPWEAAELEEWEVGAEECPASPLLFIKPHSNSHEPRSARLRTRRELSLDFDFQVSVSQPVFSLPTSPRAFSVSRVLTAWRTEAALKLVSAYCPLDTLCRLLTLNHCFSQCKEFRRHFRLHLATGLDVLTRTRYWRHQSSQPSCHFRALALCSADIRNDTIRTLTWNYQPFSSALQSRIVRVLDAIAQSDTSIGYCQGMNYLAGVTVQVMATEEECYWVLDTILRKLKLGKLYRPGLKQLKLRCFQLDHLLQTYIPALAQHLKSLKLTAKTYAARWFLTLLSCELPGPTVLVVWDLFLQYGWKALFRVMLAMLNSVQTQLLQADAAEATELLTSMVTHCDQQVLQQTFHYKVTRKMLGNIKRLKTEHSRWMQERRSCPRSQWTSSEISLPTEGNDDSLAKRLLRYLLPASMLEETVCLEDLGKTN